MMKPLLLALALAVNGFGQVTKPAAYDVQPVTQRIYTCDPGWKLQTWNLAPYDCKQGGCVTVFRPPQYTDVDGGKLYDIDGFRTDWGEHPPQCVKDAVKAPEGNGYACVPGVGACKGLVVKPEACTVAALDLWEAADKLESLEREKAELLKTLKEQQAVITRLEKGQRSHSAATATPVMRAWVICSDNEPNPVPCHSKSVTKGAK